MILIEELKENYPNIFEENLLEEISMVASIKEVPEGEEILKPGKYIKFMPLLLSGSIKILRPDAEGEELLLYHLEKGDTCAMTMSCCLGHSKSEIRAVSEVSSRFLSIPVEKMEEWSSKYKTWRNFVFANYHERMMELLDSIDNIAFNNMDARLRKYLGDKVILHKSKHLYITHQEIASDLHSSRVVISRLLKKIEKQNKLKLHRNFIEVM